MRARVLLLCSALLFPLSARAQDFGVMESAETIDQGNFKLRLNPLLFFGRDGADAEVGVAATFGYGFTRIFDLEGAVAVGDDLQIYGVTAEFNLVKDRVFNFSIIPGLHFRRVDQDEAVGGRGRLNSTGVDLMFIASAHATPRLDVYGALDLAFESITDDRVQAGDYRTVHVVPGLEYKVQENLDALVEFGIGVNDHARHYLSGGLAFYFR